MYQDIRFSLRVMRRNAGFTAMIVLMLALGVGLNTVVFCWLQTIVLHPLPGVSHPSRLVSLIQADTGGAVSSRISYPDFADIAGLQQVFDGVLGTTPADVVLEIGGPGTGPPLMFWG